MRTRVDIEDGIALVTLTRAEKRNAFDLEMFRSIARCQRVLARDRSIRVVIVTGEGVDFSAGIDLAALRSPTVALRLLWKWLPGNPNLAQQASVGWRRLPVPVIMAIHGRCWGAGMQMALGGDFRFARPDANLSIMESKWGLVPDMGGSLALRALMPIDQAMSITMLAQEISGSTALEYGLITRLDPDPVAAARDFAKQLCERSPDAMVATKRLYRAAWQNGDRYLLCREWLNQLWILSRKNQRIATQRSLGKQLPFLDR